MLVWLSHQMCLEGGLNCPKIGLAIFNYHPRNYPIRFPQCQNMCVWVELLLNSEGYNFMYINSHLSFFSAFWWSNNLFEYLDWKC